MQVIKKQPVSIYRVYHRLRITADPWPCGYTPHAGSGLTSWGPESITLAQEAALFLNQEPHGCFPQSNHISHRPASFPPRICLGWMISPACLIHPSAFPERSTGRKPSSCFSSFQDSLRNVEVISEGCPEEQLSKIKWNSKSLGQEHKDLEAVWGSLCSPQHPLYYSSQRGPLVSHRCSKVFLKQTNKTNLLLLRALSQVTGNWNNW